MAQDYDTGGTFHPFWACPDTGTLFGQTIGLAALTVGLFTLGAYLARNMSGGWGVAFWIASFVCLVAMDLTVRQSEQLTVGVAVRLRLPALRVTNKIDSAPLLAASIFLGILNIFQFFLALRSEAPLTARTEPQTRRS